MISLFGPTDSEKFAPEYKNSAIVLDSKKLYNTKNVSSITVEDVLKASKATFKLFILSLQSLYPCLIIFK